jgi:hypothetical protein
MAAHPTAKFSSAGLLWLSPYRPAGRPMRASIAQLTPLLAIGVASAAVVAVIEHRSNHFVAFVRAHGGAWWEVDDDRVCAADPDVGRNVSGLLLLAGTPDALRCWLTSADGGRSDGTLPAGSGRPPPGQPIPAGRASPPGPEVPPALPDLPPVATSRAMAPPKGLANAAAQPISAPVEALGAPPSLFGPRAAVAAPEDSQNARRLEYQLDAAWLPYEGSVQRAVAAAVTRGETRVRVDIGNAFYLLDLERRQQTNELTGYSRPVRWTSADASDHVTAIAKAEPSTTIGRIQCLVGTAGGRTEWVTYAPDVQRRVASVAAAGGSVITFTRDGATTYELNWTPATMLQTNLETGSTRPLRWTDRSGHSTGGAGNGGAGAPPPPRPVEFRTRSAR